MLAAVIALQVVAAAGGADPFVFFQPSVAMSADDRADLDRGEPVARVVRSEGGEVAVFAAIRVDIDGDRLVAWMRRIEELKKSSYVQAIGRFSSPPRIEDLAGLSLDDNELSAILKCHPGGCSLKLAAAEMVELQQAARGAGNAWQPAVQQAFRRIVLRRVESYLAGGHAAVPSYEDDDAPVQPGARFAQVLAHSDFLGAHVPQFVEYLGHYPRASLPGVESFVYWSKERLAGKPMISATHVSIVRSGTTNLPDVLVAGKELFTTHYMNASLGITALMRNGSAGHNYLVYVNRSDVDVLHSTFAGLFRWYLQRRLKSEAATVLLRLRQRLESGEPPPLDRLPTVRH